MKIARALPLLAVTSLSLSLADCAQVQSRMPSFYGKLNVTAALNQFDDGDSSGELESNSSRVGLKGDYAISDNLKLLYQAEYQVNPGEEKFANFNLTQRNSFIGLDGDFGNLIAGRHDSPSKLLENGIDLFNDLNGDFKTLFLSDKRPNDLIQYTSPTLSGFTATYVAVIDGQDTISDRLLKSTSSSITYAQGAFLFGVAMDNNLINVDSFRLMSRYREGNLQLGLLFEAAKTDSGDESGVFVSASYTIDNLVFKAQTGAADQRRQGGAQSSVGFDYNLDPESRVFAFVTHTSADNHVVNNNQFGVGFEHKF